MAPYRNNETLKFTSNLIPIAKQGGASCYPYACMNGGVCFTNTNSNTNTLSNFNQYGSVQTTTTTTTSSFAPPICSCLPQFSGSRCELYSPTGSTTAQGWNNLCRVYNERNMNICQNGGQCVFIADGKVACICPSTFAGQYCESPVYIQCSPSLTTQCHRDYSNCSADGRSCICLPGWGGARCDLRVNAAANTTAAPITQCSALVCLNGGTCNQFTTAPLVVCTCPPAFTGTRCEIPVPGPSATTAVASSTACAASSCFNGGTCNQFNIAPFIVCACPPAYTGARCEIFVPGPAATAQVATANPTCATIVCGNGGTCLTLTAAPFVVCVCTPQFTGPRCEISLPGPATAAPAPAACTGFCFGGATCIGVPFSPFIVCLCPPNLTGTQCQTPLPNMLTPAPNLERQTSTLVPRCNFTITLLNDGLFTVRFRVAYKIDGIQQPMFTSENLMFVGQQTSFTLPYYAQDLNVFIEKRFLSWVRVASDTAINTATQCTKCYKVWGVISSPRWDHVEC